MPEGNKERLLPFRVRALEITLKTLKKMKLAKVVIVIKDGKVVKVTLTYKA